MEPVRNTYALRQGVRLPVGGGGEREREGEEEDEGFGVGWMTVCFGGRMMWLRMMVAFLHMLVFLTLLFFLAFSGKSVHQNSYAFIWVILLPFIVYCLGFWDLLTVPLNVGAIPQHVVDAVNRADEISTLETGMVSVESGTAQHQTSSSVQPTSPLASPTFSKLNIKTSIIPVILFLFFNVDCVFLASILNPPTYAEAASVCLYALVGLTVLTTALFIILAQRANIATVRIYERYIAAVRINERYWRLRETESRARDRELGEEIKPEVIKTAAEMLKSRNPKKKDKVSRITRQVSSSSPPKKEKNKDKRETRRGETRKPSWDTFLTAESDRILDLSFLHECRAGSRERSMLGAVSGRNRRREQCDHLAMTAESFRAQLDAMYPRTNANFDGEDELAICSICLENINSGENVRPLPCTHIYHAK